MQPRKSACAEPGRLYVLATPIGNLGDISARAVAILGTCDIIAAENIQRTKRLLDHLKIGTKILPYHEHNEIRQAFNIATLIESGNAIALVSDSGTPTVSDPGFRLVRECRRRTIDVIPLPGPSAHIAALSASGLPSDGFLFVGFLPSKSAARQKFFKEFCDFDFTLILYESCHRITKCMNDLIEVLGPERTVCVSRELTKIHESFYIGPADHVRELLNKNSLKGEFVVVVAKKGFQI